MFPSSLFWIALWWGSLSLGAKWAYGAAFVVFIGVVGETVADLTHWIADEYLRKRVEKIAALVLILGLAGDLESISIGQREFEELVREAGEAKVSASGAADAANRANDAAAKAQQKADAIGKQADDLLNKYNASEREVERLKKERNPRTLDDKARLEIAKELSAFAPHFAGRKIKLSSYSGDAEGIVFSLEVLDVLTKAGIDVDPIIGRSISVGLVDTGLNISGPIADEGFIRAFADKLRAHIDTDICGEWDAKYPDLTILVGVKPVPGLPKVRSANSTSRCSNVR